MKKEKREKVWIKYNKRCAYCGLRVEYKNFQVDHLVPKTLAHHFKNEHSREYYKIKGDNIDSFENLMPSCRRCNHYKRSYCLEEFRKLMLTLHNRVKDHYINKVAIDFGIVRVFPFDGVFYFENEGRS